MLTRTGNLSRIAPTTARPTKPWYRPGAAFVRVAFSACFGSADPSPSIQRAIIAAPAPGLQTALTYEQSGYHFLLYLPQDYCDEQSRAWPLVLFLHGSEERGTNPEVVKKHGPPKLVAAGKHFPFILISPQCLPGKWWEAARLKNLIDEVKAKYHVDSNRIYATGLSMGGFGTWILACQYPDMFAAIVPICGGGNPRSVDRLPHVPVWAFHGQDDPVIPIQESEVMVYALIKAGNPEVKFTRYPNTGHQSWIKAYDDPELYEWLLNHKRQLEIPG